jgi:hypothetical protein
MGSEDDDAVPADDRASSRPRAGTAVSRDARRQGRFGARFWASPVRGPLLTLDPRTVLLAGLLVVGATGFLSHAAYNPSLDGNAIVDADHDLPLTFDWPTHPSWLYALTQGLTSTSGFAVVPLLLAKLWSVIPRLFAWPPVSTPPRASSGLAVALLVSSSVFLFATGVANMQYWYPFKFNFVVVHYWAAVIFVASLAVHLVAKVPVVVRAFRVPRPGQRAARRPGADAARGERPGRTRPGAPVGAHDQPARRPGLRRCRVARAPGRERRPVDRRPVPAARLPGTAPRQSGRPAFR